MKALIELSEKLHSYLGLGPVFKVFSYSLVFANAWLFLYYFGYAIGSFAYNIVH